MVARVVAPKHTRRELIERLKTALATLPDGQYALGGATAMDLLGYHRSTKDVDVFTLESFAQPLLRALRVAGLNIYAIFEPVHYAASLPGDPDPERRIDVLVPAEEPELSGIEFAIQLRKYGFLWRVFSHDLMAATKFFAARRSGDVRHHLDFIAMYRRGLFDPAKVRWMVEYLDVEELLPFDALVASAYAQTPRPRKPIGKRLPPPHER